MSILERLAERDRRRAAAAAAAPAAEGKTPSAEWVPAPPPRPPVWTPPGGANPKRQEAPPTGVLPPELDAPADFAPPAPPQPAARPVRWELVLAVLRHLAAEPEAEGDGAAEPSQMTARIRQVLDHLLAESGQSLSRGERDEIVRHAHQEIAGYGPLQPLLDDESVTEIMVNGAHDVFAERDGHLVRTESAFRDSAHLLQTIQKIVSPLGRRIDESSPMVDARLPDGSRVNAVIPPLAVKGAALTIRKFSRKPLGVEDLIARGTLVPEMAMLLRAAVAGRLNVIVSGGTGSGKTTTLNVLSSFIGANERVVTIEDAAELRLQQEHVVTLETRPANAEGSGRVAIRDLVINALRMRPDRIVVGEVRGGEALDMLQAMNTGHDGSLTTAHANSPRELLLRLETMVLMAGTDLPSRAIREQVASALDLIVHQSRLRDGSRRLTYITEVVGMEGDAIGLQDIYIFEQQGLEEHQRVRGRFRATGVVPSFLPVLEARGQKLPTDLFRVGQEGA